MEKFKAGIYKQQYKYKSFNPNKINRDYVWGNKQIDTLLADSMKLLGELNAYSSLVPDVDFFIRMNVVREATKSSMIEGTKTGVDDAVLPEEEIDPEKRDDWEEVQNYINAVNFSIEKLKDIPLSFRLIKKAHRILLSGVRGKHRLPGEIRKSQNWIGGSSLSDALFIPPHHEDVSDLLSDLEKFWHNKKLQIPILLKVAISHYQFETIHPFLDGNGRMGRLLIILQLVDSNILAKPSLYLSEFFEKNRTSYYDSLMTVRKSNNLEQWIIFFLNGIISSSENGLETFKKIVGLREKYEEKLITLGARAKNARKLLLFMYSRPIVSNKIIERELGISFNSANRLANALIKLGILKELTGHSRNRLFTLFEYLDLFKK